MATKSWTSCSRQRKPNAYDEYGKENWHHPINTFQKCPFTYCMPYHAMLFLLPPPRSKGQSRLFRFRTFRVIKHIQFRKRLVSFPTSWHLHSVISVSWCRFMFIICQSCATIPLELTYSSGFRDLHGILRPIPSTPKKPPLSLTDSLIRIVNLSGDRQPHNITQALLAIYWIPSKNHETLSLSRIPMLLRPVGHLTSQQVTNSMLNNYQQCNTSRM